MFTIYADVPEQTDCFFMTASHFVIEIWLA